MAGEPLRCAIYCRVSTEGQRERHTIARQLREMPEFVARQDWTLVDTYVDDGISGETVEARPAFRRLLDDAENRKSRPRLIDIVAVIDLDRLTRSRKSAEGALIYDHFRENGVRLATPGQGVIDLADEDQDLLAGIKREMAKWEKRKILARLRGGKVEAAKQSRRSASIDPFGLIWDEATRSYRIDPREAYVVRRIYELAIEGEGLSMMVSILADEGLQTRGVRRRSRPEGVPGPFAASTLRKILRATTYRGEFVVFARSERIAIKVPPIVTPEVWAEAQAALSGRKVETRWRHDRQYLLSGVVRCSCGYAMWAANARAERGYRTWAYYRCSTANAWRKMRLDGPCGNRSHRVEVVDTAVWRQLAEVLSTPALLRQACSVTLADEGRDWRAEIDAGRKRLAELERHVADTLRRARQGLIMEADADAALAEIARDRRMVETRIARAESHLAMSASHLARVEAIEAQAESLSRGLHLAPFEERRRLVQLLLPVDQGCGVILHPDRIEIRGVIPLPEAEGAALTISA